MIFVSPLYNIDVVPNQWREASYTNYAGDVFRVYTVCNVDVTNINNWLRTPYVTTKRDVTSTHIAPMDDVSAAPPLARDDVTAPLQTRLYVEVNFTTRQCARYPDPARLQQCREAFKLMAYQAQGDFANAMMPTWDEATYASVGVIAANR